MLKESYVREDIARATQHALAFSNPELLEWLQSRVDYSAVIPSSGGVGQSIHKQVKINITHDEGLELITELHRLIEALGAQAKFEARELGFILTEWERIVADLP